jgi:hypothetical protein
MAEPALEGLDDDAGTIARLGLHPDAAWLQEFCNGWLHGSSASG